MKFILDPEQRLFADTLDKLLTEAGTPAVIRSWSAADPGPGLALWRSLAEAGVFALAVPEEHGGAGILPVELVLAMEAIGRHAVPGPIVETLTAAALLGGNPEPWLPGLAAGRVATMTSRYSQGYGPGNTEGSWRALDADVADLVLGVDGGGVFAARMSGSVCSSLDPARRLFPVEPVRRLCPEPRDALDLGVLACAAQSLGVARGLLEFTVDYAKVRHQFGRPIGGFQAVKHQLATTLVNLEFAGPLVFGAALSHGTPEFGRDVSAAKVATAEAAYATAKTALQIHGAIGYTDEFDPSLWIRKARALHSAWGTPADHRTRIAAWVGIQRDPLLSGPASSSDA